MKQWLNFTKSTLNNGVLIIILCAFSCKGQAIDPLVNANPDPQESPTQAVVPGAEQLVQYIALLQNKRVGVVANQTSILQHYTPSQVKASAASNNAMHLIDVLRAEGINVVRVFAPEHGFRGQADAGALLKDGLDPATQLPVMSLYGASKKPQPEHLTDIDVMVFDIQDVGARFYTYLSTLHYVMEACAEQDIPLIVLDRPNPNAHYIDGPILELSQSSFVGLHPVPVVYGMTIGEYATMINGQGWLKDHISCNLTIVPLKHYTHQTPYSLPITPSPNLPTDQSIALYPSLCFFEGTVVSAGRGTAHPFEVFGSSDLPEQKYPFSFVPRSGPGAKYPKFENTICQGINLRLATPADELNLEWLIQAYKDDPTPSAFFNDFFKKLAGQTSLQKQIENGWDSARIKATWSDGLEAFKIIRAKYLIYP